MLNHEMTLTVRALNKIQYEALDQVKDLFDRWYSTNYVMHANSEDSIRNDTMRACRDGLNEIVEHVKEEIDLYSQGC